MGIKAWRAADEHTGIGRVDGVPYTYEHVTGEIAPRAEVYRVECFIPFKSPTPFHREVHYVPDASLDAVLHQWDRVNFSRGVLQLEATKNGSRREIPMNQAVYDVPSALSRSGSRLFRSSVRKAFDGALERAGIKNFHFHDLRHTFASWLTMKGRPLKEVQELLGHKSITQTERYSHLAPEWLREAVASLEFNTTSAHSPAGAAQVPVVVTGS